MFLSILSAVLSILGFAGKSTALILSIVALRLVGRIPSLRIHRSWLLWSVASSSLAVANLGLQSIESVTAIHLPGNIRLYLLYVECLDPALLAYSSFCLLQVMIALIRSEVVQDTSQTSTGAAE
jgi:hypothetical protein